MKSNPTNRFHSAKRLLTVICAGCALSLHAHAASLTWDADGTAPLNDGGGDWNATGSNWANGAAYGAWGNTTADEAIFGVANGAAGTITVGTVNANKITFNAPGSDNYTLTGGTIALGGTNPTINANTNARIDSTISHTNGDTYVRGTGTLTLGGAATFTGGAFPWVGGLNRYVPADSTGGISVVAGANITAKNFSLMQDNATNCTINYNQTAGTVNLTGYFSLGSSTAGGASGTNTATISGGTLTAAEVSLYKWATSHLHLTSAGTVNATSLRIGWVDSSPTGTINIGDGSNFSGGTSINDGGTSGNLNVNAWNIQNNRNYTLNFNGGTLKAGAAGGNWLQAGAFTNAQVQDAGGIIDNGGFGVTIGQVLSHGGVAATDGGLVFKGTGITTLGGTNTYNGATIVNSGTLRITGTLLDSAVTVKGGGTFGGTSTSGAVTVASGGTVEGGIGGSGTLSTGNLTLGTTAGDTSSLVGTVSDMAGFEPIAVTGDFNANGGAGSVTIIAIAASGMADGTYDFLTWTGASNIANVSVFSIVSRSMTPVLDLPNNRVQVTYNSAVSSIYWTGSSTAWNTSATGNWKQTSNHAATTFMQSDTVFFHDTAGSGVVDISSGNVMPVSVTFDNTATGTAYTLKGANGFSAGTFTKLNDGTVTITNSNPTTGAVAINGGTVAISQAGGLGTGDVSFDGGATLEYTGASTVWSRSFVVDNLIGTGGGKVSVASGATLGGGTLSGGGDLLKTGSGTLAFTGSGGYSGSFTVSQGTLQLSNTGGTAITLGDANTGNENVGLLSSANLATPITVSADGSGTATIGQNNNFTTLSGLITLDRATTIHTTAGDRAGISGKITGAVGTLTFTGNRVTLQQPVDNASDFTGNVVVGCQVQMSTSYGLPATASVTVNAGGYFRTIDGATIDGLNGSGYVNNNSGGGAATTPLSLGNSGGSGSFTGTLQNGSVNDIMHIVKNGGGLQEFSGTNITYTGTTLVNAGILQFSGTKSGGGAVTVKPTATLAGIGSVSGATTVEAGGFVAPGNTTIGTLTLASATLAGTYQCDLDATTSDLLAVTGTLTVEPGTQVTFSGPAGAPSYTIATFGTLDGSLPTINPPEGYTVSTATAGVVKLVKAAGFDAWAEANAPGQTMEQDHDNDGVDNGIEYFMGLSGSGFTANPAMAASGAISWPMGTSYTGTYGTNYVIQTSVNLTTWDDVPTGSVSIDSDSVDYTLPKTGPKGFARLKVTGP